MGTKAVGRYLNRLREHQKLSRSTIAEMLDTNEMQVLRTEKGSVDTRASFLFAFSRAVQGDNSDIEKLLLSNDDDDPEIGDQLAIQRILQKPVQNEPTTDTGVVQVMELALNLRKNPLMLDKWVEYGKKLMRG